MYTIFNQIYQVLLFSALIYFLFRFSAKIKKRAQSNETSALDLPIFIDKREKGYLCAHRGGTDCGPENTLSSMKFCVEKLQIDILEIDLQATKDNKIVIFHDSTLERTTNGVGKVCDFTLKELLSFDAGYKYKKIDKNGTKIFPYRNKGLKIPQFEEVINALKNNKNKYGFPLRFYLDFKSKLIIKTALDFIKKQDLSQRVILGANNYSVNKELLKFRNPRMPISCDLWTGILVIILSKLGLLDYYHLKHDIYGSYESGNFIQFTEKRFIEKIHKRKKFYAVFGEKMDDSNFIQKMFDSNVDLLLTNKPKTMKRIIDK